MPFGWPDLLRSIVDGKYFLKQFVGEENGAGVFLADAPDGSIVDVRLSPAEPDIERAWAERVKRSASVSHPHLLREVASGPARIDGNDYAYLVGEHVQERLSDVVSERILTPDEALAVTEGVLSALDHLHQRGFMHGDVTTASIVAAGDSVKLMTSGLRPLPQDELESRRAVTADLRELAETTTQMLTGKREVGAGGQLPTPFREFVRATFGTEECPAPTAAQLMGVLHGEPLSAPKRAVAENAPEPVHVAPAPVVIPAASESEPVRFQPGMATVVLAGLVVLIVAIVAYRSISGPAVPASEQRRTRGSEVPAAAAVRPSPVQPEQRPVPAERPTQRGSWAVVAAAYNNYDAAAHRAAQLDGKWQGDATVFPAKGQGSKYMVLLGTASSQKEAERLRRKALSSGMPRDTYTTKIRF